MGGDGIRRDSCCAHGPVFMIRELFSRWCHFCFPRYEGWHGIFPNWEIVYVFILYLAFYIYICHSSNHRLYSGVWWIFWIFVQVSMLDCPSRCLVGYCEEWAILYVSECEWVSEKYLCIFDVRRCWTCEHVASKLHYL